VPQALTVRSGDEAVRHLFEVAAGLDSLVVGEDQIAGQVRHCLRVAEPTLTPGLRRLAEAALRSAKAVSSRTGLGAVGRSIAAVGLELSGFRDWGLTRVLVLGTGSYAGVVVAYLQRHGCTRIAARSASSRRAARFATTHAVDVATDLAASLADSDLVVACSGNHRLIDAETLGPHRPVIVDLSGGTDIDPTVRDLGVRLITMDQLAGRVPAQDGAALAEARALVEQAVDDFLAAQRGRHAAGTVTALRAQVDELIRAELATTAGRYPPETQRAIERSLRRLANTMLHQPSTRAAASARAGELDDYRRALATVFGPGLVIEPSS
jgi:glutamyl-tRNA reductase